jgi:hypothetical protein
MRRILFATLMLAALFCASVQAAPVLIGTFNIGGNITVSNNGFNGCASAGGCITWTDPPATGANLADISGSGLTGVFSTIVGFSGNDKANIFPLTNPPNVVGGAGYPNQLLMSFNTAGVTTTLLGNFIASGIYGVGQCGLPSNVGDQCTPPGSLFNFVNNTNPLGGSPLATATWVFSGVTNDGQSKFVGNFTAQFSIPLEQVLANLGSTGSVNNSYSATFLLVAAPEAGTMSMLGLGLVLFSALLRRKARKV